MNNYYNNYKMYEAYVFKTPNIVKMNGTLILI